MNKVIKSSSIAKKLLNKGFQIIDIAPHKSDYKRTIFVFEYTEQLKAELNLIEMEVNQNHEKQTKINKKRI